MIHEDYTFKPIIKNRGDNLVVQFKTDEGYRIHNFNKEDAIKFFSQIKKQIDKKTIEIKGKDNLLDKFSYKINSEYIKVFYEELKIELMYITGKKERPVKKIYGPNEIPEVKEQKPVKRQLTEKEKTKANRERKKK